VCKRRPSYKAGYLGEHGGKDLDVRVAVALLRRGGVTLTYKGSSYPMNGRNRFSTYRYFEIMLLFNILQCSYTWARRSYPLKHED